MKNHRSTEVGCLQKNNANALSVKDLVPLKNLMSLENLETTSDALGKLPLSRNISCHE